MSRGIILSLCDVSGVWSRPYVALGYSVIRVDPKHGAWEEVYKERGLTDRIMGNGTLVPMADGGFGLSYSVQALANILAAEPNYFRQPVVGILMAPPCTDFSGSGALHWARKDKAGLTAVSVSIVNACLFIVKALSPKWWALENPVGRIASLVPGVGRLVMTFHPSDFAGWLGPLSDREAYTKRTCLFGVFNKNLERRPVEPKMVTLKNGKRGSWMWARLGGKSERTKALRSATPEGFAIAFSKANP